IDRGPEAPVGVRVHADLLHAGGEVGLVENTQHAFLAVDGGQKADAEVEVTTADLDAHAAVLREAALGDVEAAHNLQAGDERDLKNLGRRHLVDQNAVDAVAEANHALEWFDVNITGPVLDRLDQDEVGELDDRCFLGGSGKLVEIDLFDRLLDRFESFGVDGGVFGLF